MADFDRGARCGRRPRSWYVIQVERRRERAMAEHLTRILPAGVLDEPVFRPMYMSEIKVRGRWLPVERAWLDGYVIAVSSDPEGLVEAVDRTVDLARVLRTDAGAAPLSREETELFGARCADGGHCLQMSVGYKLGDGGVAVVEGPLCGREGLIARIDRHKGLATLQLEVGGQVMRARAGLKVLPLPRGDAAFERRLMRRFARISPMSARTGRGPGPQVAVHVDGGGGSERVP